MFMVLWNSSKYVTNELHILHLQLFSAVVSVVDGSVWSS